MNRTKRGALAFLLGAAVAVFTAATVLTATGHAAARPSTEVAEVAQELHPDTAQHHDDISSGGQFSPAAVQQRIQTYQGWQGQAGASRQNPVDAVRAAAAGLGLDANADSFYLVGKTDAVATVHVVHQKKGYTVTLVPSGSAWIAASISPA
ncbi:MAG: hypothetical protein P4N41_09685 [Negativicutes bacterium]|nr:hypothetical protein [Negativicutes bacterium]